MLLGTEQLRRRHTLAWQQPVAIGLGIILLAETAYIVLAQRGLVSPGTTEIASITGSPTEVGFNLFMSYLLPFEITSLLLLVAMVGAVVLTREEKKK